MSNIKRLEFNALDVTEIKLFDMDFGCGNPSVCYGSWKHHKRIKSCLKLAMIGYTCACKILKV